MRWEAFRGPRDESPGRRAITGVPATRSGKKRVGAERLDDVGHRLDAGGAGRRQANVLGTDTEFPLPSRAVANAADRDRVARG